VPVTNNYLAASVWENKAQGSGQMYWKLVAESGEKFTIFERVVVAPLIDGKTPQYLEQYGANVYNFKPPIPVTLTYEDKPRGPVLTQIFFPVDQATAGATPPINPMASSGASSPSPLPPKPSRPYHPGWQKAKESPEAAKILAEIEHDKNIHIARMNAGTGAIAVINTWVSANSSGGLTIQEVEAVFAAEFKSIADVIFNYITQGDGK
jgi:hypothetical protein